MACVVAIAQAGCDTHARPWEGAGATASFSPPAPAAPPRDGGSLLEDAPTLLESAEDAGPPPPPVKIGGPWVRCYGNFRPSGEPRQDVTRLTLLCGPANGMTRASETVEGTVTSGQAAVTASVAAARGECLRVFAVADAGVEDLDVVVRSSRGATIAADHGEDRWPIVQPDRPFCMLEDDTLTLEVTAKRGGGRFAAEVWKLLPRR